MEKLNTPILYGVAIDKNSIMWSWEHTGNSHCLYDNEGNIIAQIASNINEYVELGLNENTKYIRRLKAFNATSESPLSNTVSVTTFSEQNLHPTITSFKDEYTNTFNQVDTTLINKNLKAFKTGVGDKYDLKLFKQDLDDYNNTFNLVGKVYGKYFKNITSFQKTKFNYRVKAIGKYEQETCKGYAKLKLKATTNDKIKVRVYRYALKNMNVKAKVECRVSYYEQVSGAWYPRTKTLTSSEFEASMPSSASYTAKGNAILDIKNNILINSTPIGEVMRSIALSDPVIATSVNSGMGMQLFEFRIYDDYPFNTDNNRYSPSKPRPFTLSQDGTIQAHTSSSVSTNTSSGLYMTGYSEGQLFDCEKVIEKTIVGDNSPVVILTKEDINALKPTCISDRSYEYDGNASNIITKIEIIHHGPTISIIKNDLNSNDVLVVSANTIHETPIIRYNFNEITKNHYISTESLFSNMIKDYSVNYDYELVIIDCTSNIKLNGEEQLTPGFKKNWVDDYMSGFALEAKESIVIMSWETTYPEYPNDGLNGIVNTENSLDGTCIKKDLVVQLPEIYIPQEMFDVKFKLVVENISPQNSHLKTKLLNQDETGYSEINGDFAEFSSDATKPEIKEIKDLLSIDTLDTISLDDTITKELVTKVSKPILTTAQNNLYTSFELNLDTDSSDINISDYPINLIFDETNTCIVPYKCKVMRNATSRWSPYIHNGYYYLNQHEYYLYSQSNIEGNYIDNYTYSSKNVNYSITVNLKNTNTSNELFSNIYDDLYDYDITPNSHVEFSKGYLYPKPTLVGKYYKEYKNVSHILNELILPRKATSYNELTYLVSDNTKQVKLFMRSINENGIWSDWVLVKNKSIPTIPLSYKVQFKIDFEPNVESVPTDITETLSNYTELLGDIDNKASTNITIENGMIEVKDKKENGLFFSNITDYIASTSMQIDCYYTCNNTNESNYISIHVASSDNYDELKYNPTWYLMDGATYVTGRYIRYRIEFTSNIKIISLFKDITTLKTISTPQGINNIAFSANINSSELPDKTIKIERIANIKYNKEDHLVVNNIREIASPVIKSYGYTDENIDTVEASTNDDDFILTTQDNVIDLNTTLITDVFNSWHRFSNIKNSNIGIPKELNYWAYDNVNKEIVYNNNSQSYVGLVSPQKYINYEIKATLKSNAYSDKPICIVLAYTSDSYGKDYTLSLLVSPGEDSYKVVYNYNKEDQKTIGDFRDNVINNQDLMKWSQLDKGIRVNVIRTNNTFAISRSQENQTNIDPATEITVNLDSNPQLAIFKNGASIGFGCLGIKSIFKNLMFIISDKANSSIYIRSKNVNVDHKDGECLRVVNNSITLSPFPQQFSPIIVSTDEFEELRRIYYRENGKYSLDITESYLANIDGIFQLTEHDIDIKTFKVKLNGDLITDYTLSQNILTIPTSLFKSKSDVVEVTYRVNNSFVANYNYYANTCEITVHTETEIDRAKVKYETNLNDNRLEIKNISLNPIYNTDSKGFIYLAYEDNVIDKINIYANPLSVLANGIDSTQIYYQVVDNIGNPVQGVELSSYCNYGSLLIEDNITDENGVVTARYISSNEPQNDTVTVFDSVSGNKNSITINNMEVR